MIGGPGLWVGPRQHAGFTQDMLKKHLEKDPMGLVLKPK